MIDNRDFSLAAFRLLDTLSTLRFFHWTASSYSEHKVLGDFYDYLDSWVDSVVESYLGKGVYKLTAPSSFDTDVYDSPEALLISLRGWLSLEFSWFVGESPELLNKRDELVAELNKTLYLLRMT